MRHSVPPIRADHFVSEIWKQVYYLTGHYPHASYRPPGQARPSGYTRGHVEDPLGHDEQSAKDLPVSGCLIGVAIIRAFPQLRRRLQLVDEESQLCVRALYSELVAREWLVEQHLTDAQIDKLKAELRDLDRLQLYQDQGVAWGECLERLGKH